MTKERDVRRRISHMAAEVLVLKKSLAKIEKSMRLLLNSLEMSHNAMMDACEQIDFREFCSKLSMRANMALEKAGIVDGTSLAGLTVLRLFEIKNCGETTVKEIERVLANYCVALPYDDEPCPAIVE
jgi:DNA-directed RNA polymerase alpha subunit